jgi:pimeloyl-ACP methyl ester carboxylesterase
VTAHDVMIERRDATIAVTDLGGHGPTVILLHGLAGSSRELLPTAQRLGGRFRVVLVDQRGHGRSTRRPADVSREAFVDDVVAVIEQLVPGGSVRLVGPSMGAHTAFLTACRRPGLVDQLVMLEAHVDGSNRPQEAQELGEFFASWPAPFADAAEARRFLGDTPLATAWIDDLEATPDGLRPRFDPDIMQATIAAVHAPRWSEWESLATPTVADPASPPRRRLTPNRSAPCGGPSLALHLGAAPGDAAREDRP